MGGSFMSRLAEAPAGTAVEYFIGNLARTRAIAALEGVEPTTRRKLDDANTAWQAYVGGFALLSQIRCEPGICSYVATRTRKRL